MSTGPPESPRATLKHTLAREETARAQAPRRTSRRGSTGSTALAGTGVSERQPPEVADVPRQDGRPCPRVLSGRGTERRLLRDGAETGRGPGARGAGAAGPAAGTWPPRRESSGDVILARITHRKRERLFNKPWLYEARLTISLDSVEYYKLSGARLRTCTSGTRRRLSTFYII